MSKPVSTLLPFANFHQILFLASSVAYLITRQANFKILLYY